jgi:hypothetical protein
MITHRAPGSTVDAEFECTNNDARRNFMRSLWLSLTAATLCLTGCAGYSNNASSVDTTNSLVGLHGTAHGGQQPVGFSSIQLYQAGSTAGYGMGATPLLKQAVSTDASGNFSITGLYNACSLGSQVYITATGGQPIPGTTNSALALIAGLGLCDNVNSSTSININEVTTVGTIWALAPFMNGTTIGAPTSNVPGMASAFSDITSLVNIGTGVSNASTASIILPNAELNTIANAIAGCINTGGTSSMGCSNLFNAAPNPDSTIPTDTITAALNIARKPSRNVPAIIANASSFAVFAPTVASANDLTLAITYKGSGLSSPTGAAIDSTGNVWVSNAGNSVSEFAHNGTILSGANGYTAGSLNSPSAIAIDTTGNVWITNSGNNTLTELNSSGANVSGSPFSGGGLSSPTAIAFDALGYSWISNAGNSSVSKFSSTGTAVSGTGGYTATGLSAPVGVAVNPH